LDSAHATPSKILLKLLILQDLYAQSARLLTRELALALPLDSLLGVAEIGLGLGAGFLGAELPAALGLDGGRWIVRCAESAAGAYRMVAAMRP